MGCVLPAWGQIAQSSPRYCGLPGDVNPGLGDLWATIDPEGHAQLLIGRGAGGPGIRLGFDEESGLEDSLAEIAEVCPLSDGRLVVFGQMSNGVATYIIDRTKGSVVDHFWCFNPIISPDQRWIVYTTFYPRHTEFPTTGEYLIYDLRKGYTENRPGAEIAKDAGMSQYQENRVDVGAAIYPPGQKNVGGGQHRRSGGTAAFRVPLLLGRG